jgi:hypothetical protein
MCSWVGVLPFSAIRDAEIKIHLGTGLSHTFGSA